jgi:hypothetical protein
VTTPTLAPRFRKFAPPVLALALGALASPMAAQAVATTTAMPSDFNGDGYADLAAAAIYEDKEAGGITVLYGSLRGLTTDGSQRWSQDTPGIKGRAQHDRAYDGDGTHWGSTMASGDFDRDGHADLAVGAAKDSIDVVEFAGAVNVLYGSRRGLKVEGNQRLSQATLPGSPEARDAFGANLAAADFDGDGYADLAIGVPGEDFDPDAGSGIVQIVYGGPDGLTATGSTTVSRASTGAPAETAAWFGSVLAAGDVDGDGDADLAIHVSGRCGPVLCRDGGSVAVVPGGPDGLTGAGTVYWNQDSPGILDEGEGEDAFGWALEIGDFDGDGFGDLAVGVINEEVTGDPEVEPPYGQGAVAILRGSATGLSAEGNQRWDLDTAGIPGLPRVLDRFGSSLAAGDFDGDGADDLAIGAPFKEVGKAFTAGVVVVLYGSIGDGLTAAGAQRWTQASPGVASAPEDYDEFGTSLAAADYGRSGRDDLAIGAPGEAVGKVWRAGMVHVLWGRSTGLDAAHADDWSQDSPGVPGRPERYDSFGASLTP